MTSQRQSYKCSNMLEWFSNDWKFYYTSCYTVVWPKNPKNRFCFLKSLTIVVHILEYFSIFTELCSSMAVGLLTYLSIWNSVRHILVLKKPTLRRLLSWEGFFGFNSGVRKRAAEVCWKLFSKVVYTCFEKYIVYYSSLDTKTLFGKSMLCM